MITLSKLWKRYSFLLLIAFIILGLFDLRIAMAAIICMVGPIILSFWRGRYWCGNICPRGSFYDSIISKLSKEKKLPKVLKSMYFRIFMILFIITMFSYGIYKNWGNPYGIGLVFYRIIAITTIVGVILSLYYSHRAWCSFCPMGTISSFVSKMRKHRKMLQITPSCVSCKLCAKKCPLEIVPYNYKGNALNHPDCIQCGQCVSVCPKNAVGYHIDRKEH